jgi:hypothetical protein
MAEKEKQSEHKSTIDKYFSRTADGFKAWAEEDEEERNYLLVAIEPTGDSDEDGNQGFDFHSAYHGKTAYLADGIAQAMQRDKFLRTIVITAARKFFFDK